MKGYLYLPMEKTSVIYRWNALPVRYITERKKRFRATAVYERVQYESHEYCTPGWCRTEKEKILSNSMSKLVM